MTKLVVVDGKEVMKGRKSLCTPEILDKIVANIEICYYQTTAAEAVGISKDTLSKWLKHGESHTKTFHSDGSDCTALCDEDLVAKRRLVARIKEAQSKFELDNLKQLQKHSKKTWLPAAWLLERTQPDKFGQRQRIDHKHSGTINHKGILDLERRKRILEEGTKTLAIETAQDEDGTFVPVQDES